VRFLVYIDECRDKHIACFRTFTDALNCYILFTWIFSYQSDKGLH